MARRKSEGTKMNMDREKPSNARGQENERQLNESDRWAPERGYPVVVHFRGRDYDLRDPRTERGTAIYRMTAEYRMSLKEPDFIEVDEAGNVTREWDN